MMMIRQTDQKVVKPPPPVPPRPSKTLVAEALAKSRQGKIEASKTKSPVRQAPPPPPHVQVKPRAINGGGGGGDLFKSRSSCTVNVNVGRPPVIERSISEEKKCASRPIVYQSSNVRCQKSPNNNNNNNNNNNVNNNSKVQISSGRNDNVLKIVDRVNSFNQRVNGERVVRKESVKKDKNQDQDCNVSRKSSSVKDKDEKISDEIVKVEDGSVSFGQPENERNERENNKFKSNASTLEKSSTTSSDQSSLDNKNWDIMLNDRNHVNTLIDEMFASVLEVHFNETDNNNISNKDLPQIAKDKEKNHQKEESEITINGHANLAADDKKQSKEKAREKVDPTTDSCVTIIESENLSENSKTVIVIKNEEDQRFKKLDDEESDGSLERLKQVKFKDQTNHEILINELQCMKMDQEKILKRQRKPSMNIYEEGSDTSCKSEKMSKVPRPDFLDLNKGQQDAKTGTCHIIIDDESAKGNSEKITAGIHLDYERITKMSSLHGLPPLPKSLSGFSLLETPPTPLRSSSMRGNSGVPQGQSPIPLYPQHPKLNGAGSDVPANASGRKSTNLDSQLAILRQEMYSLRQLDLSLLSQLWSLNESIHDFRHILQDHEDRVLSPPSPSPTPSSGEDVDGDDFYMSSSSINFRPAPAPQPAIRRPSSSSNASSLG